MALRQHTLRTTSAQMLPRMEFFNSSPEPSISSAEFNAVRKDYCDYSVGGRNQYGANNSYSVYNQEYSHPPIFNGSVVGGIFGDDYGTPASALGKSQSFPIYNPPRAGFPPPPQRQQQRRPSQQWQAEQWPNASPPGTPQGYPQHPPQNPNYRPTPASLPSPQRPQQLPPPPRQQQRQGSEQRDTISTGSSSSDTSDEDGSETGWGWGEEQASKGIGISKRMKDPNRQDSIDGGSGGSAASPAAPPSRSRTPQPESPPAVRGNPSSPPQRGPSPQSAPQQQPPQPAPSPAASPAAATDNPLTVSSGGAPPSNPVPHLATSGDTSSHSGEIEDVAPSSPSSPQVKARKRWKSLFKRK